MNNLKDLLVVFSNYNGMRTKNDLKSPRLKICLDSFLTYYPDKSYINALIIDNNSTDKSVKLMNDYQSDTWKIQLKDREDYYLGTLFEIVKEFESQYKYIMIVDNDQYFKRSGFLESAISVMDQNEEIITFQINEPTIADLLDHHKLKRGVVGVFDHIGRVNGETWMRSAQFSKKENFMQPTSYRRGVGVLRIGNLPSKRICWLAFGCANVIIRSSSFSKIFQDHINLHPPYTRNGDRLAIFASTVYHSGRTGYLLNGSSINIGFRKFLPSDYRIKGLMKEYKKQRPKSLYGTDGYSFFLDGRSLHSIEKAINNMEKLC